jgi:hypothetical protein
MLLLRKTFVTRSGHHKNIPRPYARQDPNLIHLVQKMSKIKRCSIGLLCNMEM